MLANLILGIPTANYFDDIGSMSKSSISDEALATFSDFCRILAVILKDEKSGLGRKLRFIGSEGEFHAPDNGRTLTVDLVEEKKSLRADRLEEFLRICHILHKELESATGRLSYSQTSVFGRFGRGMMQPHIPEIKRGLLPIGNF